MSELVSVSSRSLTQDELDGFWRHDFVEQVLKALELNGSTVKFLIVKTQFNLVEITKVASGEWTMSVGRKHYYTYRYADLVSFIEAAWDAASDIHPLAGEFEFSYCRPRANADADDSRDYDGRVAFDPLVC